ncbi:hypothetical protein QN277_000498 [Acacia crassicarpa]|uniref:Transposase n=1 Tax=Acacia crassicarpa TaxID=499986 RepID=A0AAE1N570_9FABA|nr:hypothetical protein QN277_000498 [Acacia crassicarpa]
MKRIRIDFFQKQVRPKWIPHEVMNELERVWTLDKYLRICEVGKANRASSKGGTQHKGGSIPVSEHKRRMAEHLGRQPSVFEVFKKTHYSEKTGEFADHRAAATHDEFLRRKASITSEGGSVQSNEDELNLWLEVAGGKNKKGRIYGLGSETQHVVSSTSTCSNNSSWDFNIQQMQMKMTQMSENYEQVKQENAQLKQATDFIMSALQGMGIQLPTSSNLANQDAPSTNATEDVENER